MCVQARGTQLQTIARHRKPTVLIHIGALSLSKRAFEIGGLLALLQVLDGALTYAGIHVFGFHMEGNAFLRALMLTYGAFPALFLTKSLALICVAWLTLQSHNRRWLRPALGFVAGIYIALAIIPWTYLLSSANSL